jgi:hypothetical protein
MFDNASSDTTATHKLPVTHTHLLVDGRVGFQEDAATTAHNIQADNSMPEVPANQLVEKQATDNHAKDKQRARS